MVEYIGEHLLPGQLGHLCAVLSFVAALLSAFAYFMATERRRTTETHAWRQVGRFSFVAHGVATFAIIGILFYILVGKMYEYQYAWANVSDDLPNQYVFSAFWKEQQGSFLLWSFWHIVLGMIIMFKGEKWETSVLAVIALVEAVIASMILGLYFGDFRLGASPFDLLRDTMNAPIFQQADYLTKVKGQGLNPLLQNYWMTIHPPTLFLGFASTVVPFAFAIAGLWLREHKAWLQPALKWSLFSGAILGTGILMGGAWAYEALSFAGYWAWDPVENTSLVPWLTLVAGIHTNLIARATGHSIKSTYAFYLMSFLLILYSTYLTRSGILGDTSAHAFTEMGLGFQLVLFIAMFTGMSVFLFMSRGSDIPTIKEEERFTSREFWMFMGALVLLFSAVLLTGATSLPVFNKIVRAFDPGFDGFALTEPVEHHNRYQLWIAVFMAILSGVAQWMRYNERNWNIWAKKVGLHLGIALGAAALLTVLNGQWLQIGAWQHWTLLLAAMFTAVSNVDYLVTALRGNVKSGASTLSHLGFGILLLGILYTGLNKSYISSNTFAMDGLIEGMEGEELRRNVMLLRDAPMPFKDRYVATYINDTIERQTRTFRVDFLRQDSLGNPTDERFTVYPNVMYDREFSKVVASNPSTQHYWTFDIFTHVTSLPKAELDPEYAKQQEDSLKYVTYEARVGDTIFAKDHYIVVENITKTPKHPDYTPEAGDMTFGVEMKAYSLEDRKGYALDPMMYIRRGKGGFALTAESGQLQMKAKLSEASMSKILQLEQELKYESFAVKSGASFRYKGYNIQLTALNREPAHPHYAPEKDDIALGATLTITNEAGQQYTAAPLFLVRDARPFSLKDEVPKEGLHIQFASIDPTTGNMTINVAQATEEQRVVPVEIAENAGRSDYILLQAIIFPGIKLVWIGSILMLIGLAIGLWHRMTQRLSTGEPR
jgi:cytochrome c-type biogenesis protein CcmF